MTLLRTIYELFPPRAREKIKLVLHSHGHGQSRLDGLKARDHALGKKRLDRVAEALTAVMAQAGIRSLEGLSCMEFGAGYVPTEALVFHLLGAKRAVATDYNAIARLGQLVTAARAADRGRVLEALSPYADKVAIARRLDKIIDGDLEQAKRHIADQIVYLAPHDMSVAPVGDQFDFIHSLSVFEHLPVALVQPILANLVCCLTSGGQLITEIDLRDHRDLEGAPLAFFSPGNDYDPEADADQRGNRLRRSEWLELFTRADIMTRQLYQKNLDRQFLPRIYSAGQPEYDADDMLVSWLGLITAKEPVAPA